MRASAWTNLQKDGKLWWLGAGVGAAGLLVAWRLLPVRDWALALQHSVAGMGAAGGLVFALVYVVAALLFVPGSVLTIAAGAIFGLGLGTLIASASSTATAAAGFLIARYLARRRVEKIARGHDKFAAIDRAIARKGWKAVALLRLSPVVPFSLSNYLYGLTAVGFWPYLLASWAAMLPGTVLYVSLGAAGHAATGAEKMGPGQWALLAAGLAATIAVTVLLTRAAHKELEKHPARRSA